MFKHLILIEPLGMMYGSAGGFLSPENLVGRAGSKFPPDAATLAGLFFSANYYSEEVKDELKQKLYVAGPFCFKKNLVFVPIPWSLIITRDDYDCWRVEDYNGEYQWARNSDKEDLEPELTWQPIDTWNYSSITHSSIQRICEDAIKSPWKYNPILHPSLQKEQRTVKAKDSLFLENTVQIEPDICLVYLSTHELQPGWYRFGGENHLVEIKCEKLDGYFLQLLQEPIKKAFALITPGVWGSNRFSYRYPQNWGLGEPLMLTDKPVPHRYSTKGQLGRGRYAVPAGSVYVLNNSINKPWWEWNKEWFPQKFNRVYVNDKEIAQPGFLKHIGGGLCLPIDIPGLSNE